MEHLRHRGALTLLAAALLAPAPTARGQVLPTQDGRLLDANYLYGSQGYNSVRRAESTFNANQYVTGQVGGLYAFRGQPYAAANQLRLTLPSAGLDDFNRRAVGLDQIRSGTLYGASTYLSPQRTVLGSAGIARGAAAPGTSIPRATYVPRATAQRLYDQAIEAYKPLTAGLGEPLRVNPLVAPALPMAPPSLAVAAAQAQALQGAVRPISSALFGILRDKDKQRLVEELTAAERAADAGLHGRVDARVDAHVDARFKPKPPDLPPAPTAGPLPEPGQDVFIDILVNLQRLGTEDESDARPPTGPKPKRTQPLPVPGDEDEDDTAAQAVLPAKAVELRRGRVIVNTLAGKGRDMFNVHMTRAQALLAQGKFYEAAGEYHIAAILNQDHWLAYVGEGLARFAANEPLSAALRIRRAIKRFPRLLDTRLSINVLKLLGVKTVTDRIDRLERRLARKGVQPDPSLVFLAAFIRSSMGDRARAVEHATRLRALAGKDKIHRALADAILAGARRGAATAPATRPAASKAP